VDDTEIDPLLSRTGTVSPIGTLSEELHTKLDVDTKEAFKRICAGAGTDASCAIRNYVCKVVHGKTFDEMVEESAQRRRLLLSLEEPFGSPIQ
jgi:antitoxin component of RelBE/YafQ-DinJ toxin-antitoxin module